MKRGLGWLIGTAILNALIPGLMHQALGKYNHLPCPSPLEK